MKKIIFLFLLTTLFINCSAYKLKIRTGNIPILNYKLYAKVLLSIGEPISKSIDKAINRDDKDGFQDITNQPLEVDIAPKQRGWFKVKFILVTRDGKKVQLEDSYPKNATYKFNNHFEMYNDLSFRIDSTNIVTGNLSNLTIVKE
ncbi:hypothetical protein ACFLYH_00915 [Candidatus Dependentiae bacterium]